MIERYSWKSMTITLCRLSICFLWIFTGYVSLTHGKSIGYETLQLAHITGGLATLCIVLGALLDIILGLWFLTPYHRKACYISQIALISLYSLLLTLIAPNFWAHPFGPLSKNIPILALLWLLYQLDPLLNHKTVSTIQKQ